MLAVAWGFSVLPSNPRTSWVRTSSIYSHFWKHTPIFLCINRAGLLRVSSALLVVRARLDRVSSPQAGEICPVCVGAIVPPTPSSFGRYDGVLVCSKISTASLIATKVSTSQSDFSGSLGRHCLVCGAFLVEVAIFFLKGGAMVTLSWSLLEPYSWPTPCLLIGSLERHSRVSSRNCRYVCFTHIHVDVGLTAELGTSIQYSTSISDFTRMGSSEFLTARFR